MAKIDWVRDKLINWSRWVVERASGGSGYPRTTTFARLAHDQVSTETSRVPVVEVDAMRTHEAIEQLRTTASHLYVAVWCRYAGNPVEYRVRNGRSRRHVFHARPLHLGEIARVMQVSESTVKRYLADAELQLAALLTRREPARGVRHGGTGGFGHNLRPAIFRQAE